MSSRRFFVEFLTCILFVWEFTTNILRWFGLGRRYYQNTNRIDGSVVVVTGSNSGIGKETVYQLSKRGASVIMACRDIQKGQQAERDILTRNPNAALQVMQLDLSSLKSVNQFANEVCKRHPRVDILINNAGVMMCPKMKSQDDYELQFATNYLGHFVLSLRLLPLLAQSKDGRILNVSSVHHVRGQIFFEDINFDTANSYDPVEAYCQSKMANVLFNLKLAEQLCTNALYQNVKTYALNPGTINTNLSRHVKGVRKWIFNLIGLLFNLDIFTGTQTTLYCALDPSLRSESGRYYSNCARNEWVFRESYDYNAANRLWTLSCQMAHLNPDKYFPTKLQNNKITSN